MGNYNPRTPIVLGEEWVPIRDEELVYSPNVNSVEYGTSYVQAASQAIRDARFYVNDATAALAFYQVGAVNLYPFGLEDQTGPIKQVIIPVNAVSTTGTGMSLQGAATYPEALYQPGDNKYVQFAYNSGNISALSFWFAVSSYPELANKRILNVAMEYAGNAFDIENVTGLPTTFINPNPGLQSMTIVNQWNDLGQGQAFSGKVFASNTGTLDGITSEVNPVTASSATNETVAFLNLGDINNCWNTASLGSSEKMPWRYADLLRLQQSFGAGRQQLQLQVIIPLTSGGISGAGTSVKMNLDYVALKVTYCEEKRLAYGAQQFGYNLGMNRVTMRDLNQAADPVIPAGIYLPTLSFVSMGQVGQGIGTGGAFPELNALRELYTIPSHQGVQVNIPFPLDDHLGDTFTSEPVHEPMPQLTLHTAAGTMLEPHVYGRQAAAQVFGNNVATQEIYDDVSGVAASYPQVRYYARRFGDTTVPLTLTGTGVFTGSTASITPATFDELTEILDGWREVTLRFVSAPSMGAATGTPGWTWSAYGETSGNRWEVLAASAPAISGVPGNFYNQVPYPNQLGPATYGGSSAAVSAPIFLGAGGGAGDNNLPITPGLPGVTLQPGDWLIAFGATRGAGTITVNNGYAFMEGIQGAAVTDNVQFWGKVVGSTAETNPTITPVGGAAGDTITGQVIAIRGLPAGATPATIVVQSAGQLNGSAGNVAVPSMTTARPGMLIGAAWKQSLWTTADTLLVPAGWTEIGDLASSDGNDQSIAWDYLSFPTPGLSNPTQFVINGGAAAISRGIQFLLPFAGTTGSEVNLTWMPQGIASPWVTGSTPDPATDAVLMFSQDPATVTGMTLTASTQVVTGFALDCGTLPCCIPTGIGYNRVSWSLPVNTGYAEDAFSRTVVAGLGSPDVGGAYTLTGSAADYAVDGARAVITPSTIGANVRALLSVGSNFDVTMTSGVVNNVPAGSTATLGINGRYTDANNTYIAYVIVDPAGATVTLNLGKSVGGVFTGLLSNLALPIQPNAGGAIRLRFMGNGTYLKVKAWALGDDEPGSWNFETTDSSLSTGTLAGFFGTSSTALGNALFFEDLRITPPSYWFGALELQRWDSLAVDFETIMLSTDVTTTVFNDYEARVGVTSVYRIRNLNALNFAGQWSSQVSGAPVAPGVTGACADSTGALIFTSNADQTGARNAAYVMQWEGGAPTEDFGLPEAEMVAYQPMYGRDGSVAFHGTERGLEVFDRTVLLHAAAISPVRLADAKTIRDLAWQDLPYVCVRDDIGDRWFASVRIPAVSARMNRTKYMARVEIVETTTTPYPVDP